MKKYFYVLIINFIVFKFVPQIFDTHYSISFKFPDESITYTDESSKLEITDGIANLHIEFKMLDPKTAGTNYAVMRGSATGRRENDKITLSGSGALYTYEKDINDDVMEFSISLVGSLKIENATITVAGTFTLTNPYGEDAINGTFTGKCWENFVTLQLDRGTCQIQNRDQTEFRDAKNNEYLEIGGKIKTGENTRANLVFPDGSIFRVKSNSIITLNNEGLSIQVGELLFDLQKQGRTFQVVTPSSAIGVLGTKFIVTVDSEGNTLVNLLSGKVSIKDNLGKEVNIEKGQSVKVDNKKGLEDIKTIDTNEIEKIFESSDNVELGSDKEEGLLGLDNTTLIIISASVVVVLMIIIIVSSKKRKKKNITV